MYVHSVAAVSRKGHPWFFICDITRVRGLTNVRIVVRDLCPILCSRDIAKCMRRSRNLSYEMKNFRRIRYIPISLVRTDLLTVIVIFCNKCNINNFGTRNDILFLKFAVESHSSLVAFYDAICEFFSAAETQFYKSIDFIGNE